MKRRKRTEVDVLRDLVRAQERLLRDSYLQYVDDRDMRRVNRLRDELDTIESQAQWDRTCKGPKARVT